jgi:SAM-dependent methyltransferase
MNLPGTKKSMVTSNEEWVAWGKIDPLYAVATKHNHSQTGLNPWTDERFYQLGASEWDIFRRKWEQYGLRPGTCVEVGCGAGRMTTHLARYFRSVQGLDVSAGMIEYARARMPPNVLLHLTDGLEIPLPNTSADAIFSTHVLQHFSKPDIAADCFGEMYRVLNPGGTIMIHVPIAAWPWGSLLGVHQFIHRVKCTWDSLYAQLGRYAFRLGLTKRPPMQVIWYDVPWLYRTLQQIGFCDIEIRVLFGGSEMAVQHPFVFGTRGGLA